MKQFAILNMFLIGFCAASAQQTNVQFFPANPSTTDSVMVVMDFSFQLVNCNFGVVNNSVYSYEDRIDFYPEFCPGDQQDNSFCVTSDTVFLAPMEPGNYDINVFVGLTGQCPVGNNYTPLDTINSSLQVDIADSISETLATDVNIFPNPSYGHFSVEIKSGENYFLRVKDALGKDLFNQELNNISNTVLLNRFPKGMYLLEFESTVSKNRFIKKVVLE